MQDYHMDKDVSMLQTCLVIVNGNFKLYVYVMVFSLQILHPSIC